MLQIPKADVQIPEQDPQEMGSIYFSLENQINLVQASQTPGNTIEVHPKEDFSVKFPFSWSPQGEINSNYCRQF